MRLELTAERVARNQSAFREANEQIERTAEAIARDEAGVGPTDRFPFICECPSELCTDVVRLSLIDYEVVRSRGAWFLVAPGHETCVVDGQQVAAVARRHETHTTMEKVGHARAVVEQLDPRS